MIRLVIAFRLAMVAGLLTPGYARAQDSKPAEAVAPAPVDSTRPREVRFDFTTGTFTEPAGAEDETTDPKAKAAELTLRRALPGLATRYYSAASRLDDLGTKYGLTLAPVDDVLRAQLEIARGQGVVVLEVKTGSLSEQAGVKAKDVILSLGSKEVLSVTQATEALLHLGKDAVEVKLIREGKPRRMSLVGPEHGFQPDSSEFWIGVPVSPVDATLRSHLGELPADAGLIANDVVKASPAERVGVKKYDILVSIGGKTLKTADDLIAAVQASKGQEVPLVVLRAGKGLKLAITPTKRAHPTVISLNAASGAKPHDVQYRVMQPRLAIEVQQSLLEAKKLDDIQIQLSTGRLKPPESERDARIEAQLKELVTKLEEVRKTVEGLKKPEAK